MNFYKRYSGDYMRSTGTLSLAEHGAYSLMLDLYYSTEKPLPKGKDLYRLLRCETASERKAVDYIVGMFWTNKDDGIINKRALEEIEKADKIRDRNKSNGLKGGRPSEPKNNPDGFENGTQKEPTSNPRVKQHQTPDTRHQTLLGRAPCPHPFPEGMYIEKTTGEVLQFDVSQLEAIN